MNKLEPISTDEAAARILRMARPLAAERLPLAKCEGRVLRANIRSDRAQPPFDRVTMDGYALNSDDWNSGRRGFPIAGIQRAGERAGRLNVAGTCLEVMTGAVLPHGCNCVVPFEMADRRGDSAFFSGSTPGRFIHRAGSDLKRGTIVLRDGTRLGGPEIGIAAAVGCTTLLVSKSPCIALVTTGDEVVPVASKPLPHQIRASNAAAISASLRMHGFGAIAARHVADDEAKLKSVLAGALRKSDVLILTGGVSKGRFDFIPGVLAALGVRAMFHGVKQQPGKPMWFGRAKNGALVFGLPGNPVSALVGLHRYVLPALARAAGFDASSPLRVEWRGGRSGPDGLTLFRPARISQQADGRVAAEPVPMKNSGDFFPLVESAGFVEIPSGSDGGLVAFRSWRNL